MVRDFVVNRYLDASIVSYRSLRKPKLTHVLLAQPGSFHQSVYRRSSKLPNLRRRLLRV